MYGWTMYISLHWKFSKFSNHPAEPFSKNMYVSAHIFLALGACVHHMFYEYYDPILGVKYVLKKDNLHFFSRTCFIQRFGVKRKLYACSPRLKNW